MLNGKTKRYLGYGKEKNDFQSFRFLRTRAKKNVPFLECALFEMEETLFVNTKQEQYYSSYEIRVPLISSRIRMIV